ncbi:MAG TPA: hypothetical protein PK915_09495 [Bacteroidales bacterium]|nr:hypothetical protein [Bacteroidales bacterium]
MLKSNRTFLWAGAFIFAMFVVMSSGYSQSAVNSPYSRFGLGDLATQKSTYYFSMGGVANAVSSPFHVNPYNPAANAAIDTMSFIFSGGIVGKFGNISTDDNSTSTKSASLGYLNFGFPINRLIKTSLGLIPYSNVGYQIVSEEIVENVGNTRYYFEGTGGANEAYLGLSVQPHKNLSFGIKSAYLFGKSERSRSVFFPDSIGYINTRVDNQIDLSDFHFDFGLQYKKILKNGVTFGLGGVYAPSQKISSTLNNLTRSYFATSVGVESYRDTIDSNFGVPGSVTFPEKYGFGMMLKNKQKWMLAADFNWQNWSEFEAFGVVDSLSNSWQFAIGGEYLPSEKSVDSYWKKVKYRFGFNYNQTYLNLRNTQINEFGITFGMALPIPRSFSTVNLGFEIGRGGTKSSNLIQDNFVKINLDISVWERWFIKRKYY